MDCSYVRADGIGFLVFVIIVIVVNVIKKLAGAQTQKPTTTSPSPGVFKAPQDELNEFLKSIAQAQEPAKPVVQRQVAAPPRAAPKTKPQAKPPRPAAAPVPPPVVIPPEVPATAYATAVATAATTVALPTDGVDSGHAPKAGTVRRKTGRSRGAVAESRLRLITGNRQLQQAIIAREVLGPPNALKSGMPR